MQNLNTITKNLFLASLLSFAAFAANATTGVELVSDNYLYESLIQAEFDIDTQTEHAIVTSVTKLDNAVLMDMVKESTIAANIAAQNIAE